jgi:muramidase (phage lysozyme)
MISIPTVGRAFLDALAVGESEPPGTPRGSGYNKLCGGGTFSDFSKFPEWDGVHVDGVLSHAAGRYQFEPATWHEEAVRLGLSDFSASSQDAAGWSLAVRTYHARTNRELAADLAAGHFGDVAPALHATWPSLSPETFPARFRQALAALQSASTPTPAPAPISPISPGIGIGIGGPYTAALAAVLIWASHWPLQPLDGGTALSLAGLIMGAVGLWMHARQSSPSKGQQP